MRIPAFEQFARDIRFVRVVVAVVVVAASVYTALAIREGSVVGVVFSAVPAALALRGLLNPGLLERAAFQIRESRPRSNSRTGWKFGLALGAIGVVSAILIGRV